MNPRHQPKWTEASLTSAMVRHFFQRAVLAIPCCGWTGHEADLLVVTRDLRLIDVEMKISRADLKADAKKEKWWVRRIWPRSKPMEPLRRDWPPQVWKHYYLMPRELWDDSLYAHIPGTSGVLLAYGTGSIAVKRRATPNKHAERLAAHEAIDLARLMGLRYWDLAKKVQHQ